MMKSVDCDFCGKAGPGSWEHVWARWLHDLPGAQFLLDAYRGERMPRLQERLELSPDGTYQIVAEQQGRWSTILPHVKVIVCEECNNGWMSQLEADVKELLGPYLFSGSVVSLDQQALARIAAWATKTWMAYALNLSQQQNPFSPQEYENMAGTEAPIPRSQIWMMEAHSELSQVGVGIEGLLMGTDVPDLVSARNNAAVAYLAVGCAVFFMILPPPDTPPKVVDAMVNLVPMNVLRLRQVRRIWPNPRKQYFPLDPITPLELDALLQYPALLAEASQPTAGLTPREVKTNFVELMSQAEIDLGNG